MGCGVQARGRRQELSLRYRLLAAAAGIVAVSLILSGALTWVLVRDVALQGAQDELDRAIVVDAVLVRHQECAEPPAALTGAGAATCILASPQEFMDRMAALAPTLDTDRLLLLNRQRVVMFDSSGGATGQVITVTAALKNRIRSQVILSR